MDRCPSCGKDVAVRQADLRGPTICEHCAKVIPQNPEEEIDNNEPVGEDDDDLWQIALEEEEQEELQRRCELQQKTRQQFLESDGPLEVKFRSFTITLGEDYETVFQRAADFANSLAPEALINICPSPDSARHLMVVWYWEKRSIG